MRLGFVTLDPEILELLLTHADVGEREILLANVLEDVVNGWAECNTTLTKATDPPVCLGFVAIEQKLGELLFARANVDEREVSFAHFPADALDE